MSRADLSAWVERYERAWRCSPHELADALAGLFAPGASYQQSPVEPAHTGLLGIAAMWEETRATEGEVFTMDAAVVAFEGDTGVVRVRVRYGDPVEQEYLDLWVVRLGQAGLAVEFEEWPYWEGRGYSAR